MLDAMDTHRSSAPPGAVAALSGLALAIIAGCSTAGFLGADVSGLAGSVATKAVDVAERIGGEDGFGGTLLGGYMQHVPMHMGFSDANDLAAAGDDMLMVRLYNEADEDATFHLSYYASHMGLDEQSLEVEVRAGEEFTVGVPCAEIVGVGPLDQPGEAGLRLATGEDVDNLMAVPAFLGMDYMCGDVYECFLAPDGDDLDGDGDTEDLIILTEAAEAHMADDGPMGHMHGSGFGMMGLRLENP